MEDKPIDSLNMIPFIDIMLVLLTIVLTTSSFIAQGRIPIRLPQAAPDQEPDLALVQIIELDGQGTIYHEGGELSLEALKGRLSGLSKDTAFIIRADKTVRLQKFVDVADALRQLNFSRVAVRTETLTRPRGDEEP
ncbi:MAG: biopolymer transporter ExbD [Deltaproteobacteria bacterium]|jgi:biopolymer transport protein ExbD|nr:biopolymer transporter ExbD [Deltaproteobacteria bacterium]